MSHPLSRRALLRSTIGVGATATLVRGATLPGPAAAARARAGATPFLPYSAGSYFKSRVDGCLCQRQPDVGVPQLHGDPS